MVRFQYLRTGLDFEVRNPVFGNTDSLEFSRISRKSLGGDSIIYRDPSWPKAEVLSQTFDLPPCDIARDNLRQLIADALGDYFIYTDFCGFIWKAILKNPDSAIMQNSINTFTVTMEMEVIPVTVSVIGMSDALTLNEVYDNVVAPELMTSFPIGNLAGQQPSVYVGDIDNDFDLYELNPDAPTEYPASCVKLMTLLLAYEYKSSVWTSEAVTLTSDDVTPPIPALDSAGFLAGDVTTFEGLAYGLLLPSGFDACQCIARIVGDLLYSNAGNTGNQGVVRFVERMNERGTELGLTNSTFTDPFGGSKTFSPTVVRNIMSARDLAKVCVQTFTHSALRGIASTPTHGVAVTGGSPRTITMTNFSRFINGPTASQAGISDPNVIASKNGIWVQSDNGIFRYNIATIWTTPSGTEVVIVTMGSKTLFGAMLDQRGLMYSIPRDFEYLADHTPITDAHFGNVKMLLSDTLTDDSSVSRSVIAHSVGTTSPLIDESTASALLNANSDYLYTDDAADISVTSNDMTTEVWYSGLGAEPGGEAILFCKWDSGANQREWLIERGGAGGIDLYVSTNGSSASFVNVIGTGDDVGATFFNGAPRHVAIVKEGSTWAVYLDGERMANTITAAAAFNGTAPLSLGYTLSSVSATGSYDDFRATFGTARYSMEMVTLNARKFPRS